MAAVPVPVRFTTRLLLIVTVFSAFQLLLISSSSSIEYQVGGNREWGVPPTNDTNFYNNWASQMRFKVGDTIRFKYKKDSVMEVNEVDYKKCNSTRPTSFSNTGNTIVTLNRSGNFYFISGAFGHCDKGQRMILTVMAPDHDQTSSSNSHLLLPYKGSLALGLPYTAIVFFIINYSLHACLF